MNLQALCNISTALYTKLPIHRHFSSPDASRFPSNSLKCRNRTILSELQTPEGVTGPSVGYSQSIPSHKVTVHEKKRGIAHEFYVPEDQYILHTAESQSISLPFSCRHGCCTSCAVRVKSGQIRQPEALGISAELKSKGYALLCVGFPSSDIEVETQDEDEGAHLTPPCLPEAATRPPITKVYWLQFGRYFSRAPIERDDYALELAMGDE